MKHKKELTKILIILICVICLINVFVCNQIDNYEYFLDSNFKGVKTFTLRSTYYLSDENVLFCPKYNIDAGGYAPINKNKVIGKNVISFNENYYINTTKELYIWGTKEYFKGIPGYINDNETNFIADNVIDAECNSTYTAYININNELWCYGSNDEMRYVKFTKIADDAKRIVNFNGLAYININDNLCKNGEVIFEELKIKDAISYSNQTVLLTTDNELYFCGKLTDNYISNEEHTRILIKTEKNKIIKLKENIEKIVMDTNIIAALDYKNDVYIWGYFFGNDNNYNKRQVNEYFDYKIASNVKDVSVSTYAICMIDSSGKTFAYGENYYLSGIGNSISSEKKYIGLNAIEPIRWTEEDKYFD